MTISALISTEELTTADLREVGELGESLGITERDVEDSVVSESGEDSLNGGLLSSSGVTSGDEHSSVFAVESS